MKTFKSACAQGDVLIRKIDELPAGLKPVSQQNGEVIVTHSETGHHHVMVLDRGPEPNVRMWTGDNPLMAWLEVSRPTSLDHKRPHDTHESIMFDPGVYEIRRQREHTPDGWRQVQD